MKLTLMLVESLGVPFKRGLGWGRAEVKLHPLSKTS